MFLGVLIVSMLVTLLTPASGAAQEFVFEVNNTLDLPDTNLSDFKCVASNGQCTLRAAVEQLNSIGSGPILGITFQVPGMVFNLDASLTLAAAMTIEGYGIDFTTINGIGIASFYVSEDVEISGLTITNGPVTLTQEHSLTMKDCKLTGSSGSAGGALYSYGLALTLTRCQFIDNHATYEGGAVYATPHIAPGSSLTITDCEFLDNTAGEEGGAIYSEVDCSISGSTIESNTAAMDGGGIFIAGNPTAVTIHDTNIGQNHAVNGGGIALDTTSTAPVKISNSSIFVNTASADGGGIHTRGNEVLHVTNSTIAANSADNNGGGIAFANASVAATLNSCTIADNTADADGLTDNGNGGGVYNATTVGIIEVRNTMIADNDDASVGAFGLYAPDCSGELYSYRYNLIGYTNSLCNLQGDLTGNIVGDPSSGAVDPRLGILIQGPGWPTFAYAMVSDTPAKDAANGSGWIDWDGSWLSSDQIGVVRPTGAGCDIGARELGALGGIFNDGFESADASRWSATTP